MAVLAVKPLTDKRALKSTFSFLAMQARQSPAWTVYTPATPPLPPAAVVAVAPPPAPGAVVVLGGVGMLGPVPAPTVDGGAGVLPVAGAVVAAGAVVTGGMVGKVDV